MNKSRAITGAVVILIGIASAVSYTLILQTDKVAAPKKPTPAVKKTVVPPAPVAAPAPAPASNPPSVFNKQLYSIDASASLWMVVNKTRPLQPLNYAPGDLVSVKGKGYARSAAAYALNSMFASAQAQGISLTVISAYRSYETQAAVYNSYVSRDGRAVADTYSARPGYSEHQTGLAIDIGGVTQPGCNLEVCYGATAEGQWLAAHAHEHGFIVRYAQTKQAVTGYQYEPWHVRYVGPELSKQIKLTGVETLEEFFGLPPAPNYQ